MAYEQDPRNIFVNQRQGYSESTKSNNPNGQNSSQQSTHNKQANNAPSQEEYNHRVEEMKRLAAKYEREGEGQLVKDIVNNVIEQKARGQLSNEQLVAFAKRIAPLLNSEQRSRLEGLLEQLLKL